MRALRYYLGLTLLLGGTAVSGQAPKIYKIRTGSTPDKFIPAAERFQLARFQPGVVSFLNGRSSTAMLNYSYLGGEILFLDPRNDTLELLDKAMVKTVVLDGKTYVHDKRYGYSELVSSYPRAKLGKRDAFVRMGTERGGPYGISYTASSVTTYRSFYSESAPSRSLEMDADALFTRRALYFLIDLNNYFLIPGKNSINKLFPRNKKEINAYLESNPVNYTSEADLIRLLEFCSKLEI